MTEKKAHTPENQPTEEQETHRPLLYDRPKELSRWQVPFAVAFYALVLIGAVVVIYLVR